jgi:hypothetical protein
MGLAGAIKTANAHDLADLTAFVVSECEMVTQDADGRMIDIKNDDVVTAIKAWADMYKTDARQEN